MRLDVHPRMRAGLGDPQRPLVITEGIKKADAATATGLCTIALLGVASWRGKNEERGLVALADWEHVHLKGRRVFVVFDSDVMVKAAVYEQLRRLRTWLAELKDADVLLVYLPGGPGGEKVGLDDYLAQGHTRDDLLALGTKEMQRPHSSTPTEQSWELGDYRMTLGGIFRRGQDGAEQRLTDFAARVRRKVVEDDGLERRQRYDLDLQQGDRRASHSIPTGEFEAMKWPREVDGVDAWIAAGASCRDHARSAIDLASKTATRAVVYTHSGWRQLSDGRHVYLHGAGAIGSEGVVEGVEVQLPEALAGFRLPVPPSGAAEQEAVRASLAIADARFAPDRLTLPILAAVYRAPLGIADFTLTLAGETGLGKTELAALAQQHFGALMDSRHLPASFEGTANYIAGLCFAAKDALVTADDYKPRGNRVERQKHESEAVRLITGQGNLAGRGRANTAGDPRAVKSPRGLLTITGEEVPPGHSTRGRQVILDVCPGNVDGLTGQAELGAQHPNLDLRQRQGREGQYALAMAGYLRWLAGRHQEHQDAHRTRVAELRSTLGGAHSRTPNNLAELLAGFERFLDYAADIAAINRSEAEGWRVRALAALLEVGKRQSGHLHSSRPEHRFLELLGSAIASGRAHVASSDGREPDQPLGWGWRGKVIGFGDEAEERWDPLGGRVGWLDGTNLYLDKAAAFRAATEMDQEGIGVSVDTLVRRLKEASLLLTVEDKRERLTVRRTLEGMRHYVLHLSASSLQPPVDPNPEGDGPVTWAGPEGREDQTGPFSETPFEYESSLNGPVGPIGPVMTSEEGLGNYSLALPSPGSTPEGLVRAESARCPQTGCGWVGHKALPDGTRWCPKCQHVWSPTPTHSEGG